MASGRADSLVFLFYLLRFYVLSFFVNFFFKRSISSSLPSLDATPVDGSFVCWAQGIEQRVSGCTAAPSTRRAGFVKHVTSYWLISTNHWSTAEAGGNGVSFACIGSTSRGRQREINPTMPHKSHSPPFISEPTNTKLPLNTTGVAFSSFFCNVGELPL